jgi:lipopolysaccharide transport system ATP-binding protein
MIPAIKIQNVSKQYRLGLVGTGTLSHDLRRWWHLVRGKEDPYLKIGDINDRSTKGTSDYIWALRDINFEVQQGDVLGIIGKNGAGKSTLLKILSKVTAPTTGSITYKGRIASLLEVGTGFHPELTGRENIYVNGSILGMRKNEIGRKFDEIVDFSGCERYIDTPVKRYSSGMTVRLGFAVAAFLEPEILVVDEVLAVGDAEFQKKAIGKMQDVSHKEGRTVLFVSHNLASVQSLCTNGILLNNGELVAIDNVSRIIDLYSRANESQKTTFISWNEKDRPQSDFIKLFSIELRNKGKKKEDSILINLPIELEINFETKMFLDSLGFSYHLHNRGATVFVTGTPTYLKKIQEGKKIKLIGELPKDILNNDEFYSITIVFILKNHQFELALQDVIKFIPEESEREGEYLGKMIGITRPNVKWEWIY